MPRTITDGRQYFAIPDDTPDDDIPNVIAQLRFSKNPTRNAFAQMLLGAGQQFAQNYGGAPESTIPAISGANVAFLGQQGTQHLMDTVQRSNQDVVQQKLAERAQRAQQLENEKDRQQAIKLEAQRHKNDLAEAKLKAELDTEFAQETGQVDRNKAETEQSKASTKKTMAETEAMPNAWEATMIRDQEFRNLQAREDLMDAQADYWLRRPVTTSSSSTRPMSVPRGSRLVDPVTGREIVGAEDLPPKPVMSREEFVLQYLIKNPAVQVDEVVDGKLTPRTLTDEEMVTRAQAQYDLMTGTATTPAPASAPAATPGGIPEGTIWKNSAGVWFKKVNGQNMPISAPQTEVAPGTPGVPVPMTAKRTAPKLEEFKTQ